ncbi:hypothetical protein K438DRAFT_1943295 [Mycena galopus ATCC 62051]|nr:hypothetical protein K438DRAFT_1943295 [Mycena galopus ATCC 62051]
MSATRRELRKTSKADITAEFTSKILSVAQGPIPCHKFTHLGIVMERDEARLLRCPESARRLGTGCSDEDEKAQAHYRMDEEGWKDVSKDISKRARPHLGIALRRWPRSVSEVPEHATVRWHGLVRNAENPIIVPSGVNGGMNRIKGGLRTCPVVEVIV